jgi:hypothetical protein
VVGRAIHDSHNVTAIDKLAKVPIGRAFPILFPQNGSVILVHTLFSGSHMALIDVTDGDDLGIAVPKDLR